MVTVVIKAQVLVGGRGLAGGIRLARNANEAEQLAATILGMEIKGLPVHRVLVDEAASISEELYLGITIDRSSAHWSSSPPVPEVSISKKWPRRILRRSLRYPSIHCLACVITRLANWQPVSTFPTINGGLLLKLLTALWNVYTATDATLVEINPLVLTKDKTLIALDGKMTIDDNALPLHPDLAEMRDLDAEVPEEIEARKYGLTYIKLNGSIGCLVNGAGLAMATMDIIKLHGGEPANFLDIGGGASAERVSAALRIILEDKHVKAILINIFGGITRCDEVARGILSAIKGVKTNLPIVIRLAGTNAEEGMQLLANSKLITAETLVEAAEKAVAACPGGKNGHSG